uniref:Uncharacterized protein n=1 Tax=Aegilops tauschii subsp. strangulata TaxID=200361 RepID=A0A453AZJ8_AEGTS
AHEPAINHPPPRPESFTTETHVSQSLSTNSNSGGISQVADTFSAALPTWVPFG